MVFPPNRALFRSRLFRKSSLAIPAPPSVPPQTNPKDRPFGPSGDLAAETIDRASTARASQITGITVIGGDGGTAPSQVKPLGEDQLGRDRGGVILPRRD